ncbi:MAG: citrate synthase [Dehalococcoidia bacterium]|nr:citrate (Si)-synthase [Chloroflexota bacterium]|tara:strand:+ start:401 stop:1708 length:1308 start_codon:yes stop_codon:yes gene_type:complete
MADSLSINDTRTGNKHELSLSYGTHVNAGSAISAKDLREIKTSDDDFGVLVHDPGFMNTSACKSSITYIDGDAGILLYRGYPIEELAAKSTYLEVAYLLLHGELPNESELNIWTTDITNHTFLNEKIKNFLDGFRYDAHPMGILVSSLASLSTFYPKSRNVQDEEIRARSIRRLIAKIPTLAAFAYRYSVGLPYAYPDNDLSYSANFLNMMFRATETKYDPDPVLERTLDILLILHADHEQNCSTSAMRAVGSSDADPYVSVSAATAGLYGPLHGGANERVLEMLAEIGSVKNIASYIEKVKQGEFRLMGFGHRVYKNFDPRANILKKLAEQVFEVTAKNELLDIAIELEKVALNDEYFVKRKLYPNVDFYSGIIYQAMGIPVEMFPVLFAIARTSGWLSHWDEMRKDPELKIARPRQIYTGYPRREYVQIGTRH